MFDSREMDIPPPLTIRIFPQKSNNFIHTENHSTRILKRPRRDCRFEEKPFRQGVPGQAVVGAVCQRPERGDDDDFRAFGDQFAKGFGEGEVPADEETDGAEGRADDFVRGVRGGGEVGTFGMPLMIGEDSG